MKTIIYLRTSTGEQNPQNQIADCLTLVGENEDYTILEEKQSAFKDKDRPIWESVRKRIMNGEVKRIICWDLDRLYRKRKKIKEFFEFCKVYNCRVYSYRQSWLESLHNIPEPFNEIIHELMLQIMGWLAEEESQKKSERVKIAFQRHKGKWGRPSIHTNKKKIVWDLRDKGLSIRAIARETKLSIGSVSSICSEKRS